MSNATFEAVPILALLIESLLLAWALLRKDKRPMAAINGLAGLAIAGLLVPSLVEGPAALAEGLYGAIVALCVLELIIAATSLTWLARQGGIPSILVWLGYSFQAMLGIVALAFVHLLSISRWM